MRKLIYISILMLIGKLHAQQDFILYHMPSIPQITTVDPASFPDSKLDIGIPGLSSIYGSAFNTGFSFGDIFTSKGGELLPNIDFVTDPKKMKDNNFFILNGSIDLVFVGFRKGNNFYSFNVTEKFDFTFNYPRDLVTMALEGNGNNLLGKRASFDGLGIDFTHWREYAVHWVHDVNHKFSYGARLKYLYGMENFSTDVSKMGITTDANTHALTFDMNFDVRTSGLPVVAIGDSLLGIGAIDESNQDLAGFSSGNINNYLFGRKNTGGAIDLGFNYHLNDKVLLEASVLDLGRISWNDFTANSRLDEWQYTYSGIDDPLTTFGQGSSVDYLKNILEDSIEASLIDNYTYEANSPNTLYKTWLRTKIYASAEYIVDHNNFVSVSFYSSFVRKRWRRGMGVAYNYHLGNFLAATASYSIYNRSYSNLGLGLSLTLGPFEIYALTDNVLAFGLFNPVKNAQSSDGAIMVDTRNVRNGQFRVGMNLTFGREKTKKDPEDPNRASTTSSTEKSTTEKEASNKTEKANKPKATNATGSAEPAPVKRTNYNDKGSSETKSKSKKTKGTNYNKESSKKKKNKNKRKGPLVPNVEETTPKGSTFRKVSKKI
jgi:hypothetical protein